MGDSILCKLMVRIAYVLIASGFRVPGGELATKFLDVVYLRDLIKKRKVNCILDVGANRGDYVKLLRKLGYQGYIFSFEPNPSEFDLLTNNFKKDRFWKGFNFALGSEDTTGNFNVTKESFLSSFLPPKNSTISEKILVEIKRLDSIFNELLANIQNPRVFLKIDTQGYDLEVVKGSIGCIDRILALQSEISVEPIYENMPHYLEALKYYESLGYKLMNLSIVNRTRRGSILEYDCVMARIGQTILVENSIEHT